MYTIPMIIQYYQVLIIYYHDMYIRVLSPVSTMLSTCKVMLVTEVLSLGGTIWTPRTTQGHHRPGCRSDFTRSRLCQGAKATPCISVVVQSTAEPFWMQQRQVIPAVHCTNAWDLGIFE